MIRRTRLKRTGRPLAGSRIDPRRSPAGIPPDAWRNAPYRRFLAENGRCAAAAAMRDGSYCVGPIDPCHTQNNGMGSKGPDSSCAPLCRLHHQEYDAGRRKFEYQYGVDMAAEAAAWWKRFNDLSASSTAACVDQPELW